MERETHVIHVCCFPFFAERVIAEELPADFVHISLLI